MRAKIAFFSLGRPIEVYFPSLYKANECTEYKCKMLSGLQKSSYMTVKIIMKFISDKMFLQKLDLNSLKNDEFQLKTGLKIGNDGTAQIKTVFTRIEKDVGLIEFAKQTWPMAVGGLVAIVVFSVVLYFAFRGGALQKLRFTKHDECD